MRQFSLLRMLIAISFLAVAAALIGMLFDASSRPSLAIPAWLGSSISLAAAAFILFGYTRAVAWFALGMMWLLLTVWFLWYAGGF